MLQILTPEQREEFERCGYFVVNVTGHGRFCILPSKMFNVLHIDTGDCYCAILEGDMPLFDLMLAQKLILENDPTRFFGIANRRRKVAPPTVNESVHPEQVLSARAKRPNPRVRWWMISMIPHESDSP
jgi:hypothetical protein